MDAHSAYRKILTEMKKHIAGKEETLELMFITVVANGHALLEGVPGVAKTTMCKTMAEAMEADFKRIQGTPDLVPSDIVGNSYLDEHNEVRFRKGPVFTNILLVDELNRAPPKTMSALLETLEEKQVTAAGMEMQDYSKKFSKISLSDAKKAMSEIAALGISEKTSAKMVELMPTEPMQIKHVLVIERKMFDDETVNKIAEIIKSYQ